MSQDDLTNKYGTIRFGDALGEFIVGFNNPGLSATTISCDAKNLSLPFYFPVFYHLKFWNSSGEIQDAVQAQPKCQNKNGHKVPGCFDTVLVKVDSCYTHGA
jgi:hypothetical protein